jgi:hypothetical protein
MKELEMAWKEFKVSESRLSFKYDVKENRLSG